MLRIDETLSLAEGGRGKTAPNPMVGAVVVRDGQVIATGFHAAYGGLHAEAAALDHAGAAARGSTLYCNLEPCSHTAPEKHQPSCTRRIIAAGVNRVVIGQLDPNPLVCGDGVRQLREAGIGVTVADLDQAWRFNDVYNTRMALGRPFVHLKAAISLDGRIATAGGDSRWITDDDARNRAHTFRAERDAVVVGIQTVLQDDPRLTTRLADGVDRPSPRAVVFDSHLQTPLSSRLVRDRPTDLTVLCSDVRGLTVDAAELMETASRRRHLEDLGVTVMPVPVDSGTGNLSIIGALEVLHRQQIRSVLVEGGARLLTSFVRSELYDRLSLFIAPTILGSGPSVFGDIGVTSIAGALRPENPTWLQIGDQQLLEGYHPQWLSRVRRSEEVPHVYGVS